MKKNSPHNIRDIRTFLQYTWNDPQVQFQNKLIISDNFVVALLQMCHEESKKFAELHDWLSVVPVEGCPAVQVGVIQ